VLLALAAATAAQAQARTSLTCDDVEFKPSTIERFPSVAQSCNSVVTRNDGKVYVRLVAEVIRVRGGSVLIYLKGPDGSRIRQEWTPPPGFEAMISGKPMPLRALRRGQEIRLYLPENDWQVADASTHE
jgi:ketosteroid isomerase-like protein